MWPRRSAIITVVPVLPLTHPLRAIAQQPAQSTAAPPEGWCWGPGTGHMMWAGGYGWHFWWMPPIMMLFMLLVVAGVFYLLSSRRTWGAGSHYGGPPWHMMDRIGSPSTHTALQILNERFAKGEIQKDEYEERKNVILSSSGQR